MWTTSAKFYYPTASGTGLPTGLLSLIRTSMCELLTVQRPRQDWAADKRNLYLRLGRGGQNGGIPPETSAQCSVRLRRFRPFRTAGFLVQAANGQTRPLPSAAVIVSTYSRGAIGELTTDNCLRSLKGTRSRLLLSQVLAHDLRA